MKTQVLILALLSIGSVGFTCLSAPETPVINSIMGVAIGYALIASARKFIFKG